VKKARECQIKVLIEAVRVSGVWVGVDCLGEACAWYVVGFPEGCAVKVAAENLEGSQR